MLLQSKNRKLRSEELKNKTKQIIESLPILSKRDIRRHRMPLHEALFLELEEDGFENSAHFLNALIQYQENICAKAGIESIEWYKPKLKDDKKKLEKIYDELREAETGLREGKIKKEIDSLLNLGVYFSNLHRDWWWIAEQLFLQTLASSEHFYDDGGERKAIVNYIFGRFLFNQVDDPEKAREYLQTARKLAAGQNWTASEYLQNHQNLLYIETCLILYKCLIKIAKQLEFQDPEEALKLSFAGQKLAQEANCHSGEAECILEQGICEMKLRNSIPALQKLNKVLIMYYSAVNKTGVCQTRIELAKAQNQLNAITEAKYHLMQLFDFTQKHHMQYYHAFAHRYLGELYLMQNNGQEAQVYLLKAVELFREIESHANEEQCKNLAAIATGLQLVVPLIKIIRACERKNVDSLANVIKFVRWKDTREPFWDIVERKEKESIDDESVTYEEFPEDVNLSYIYKEYLFDEIISMKSAKSMKSTKSVKSMKSDKSIISAKSVKATTKTVSTLSSPLREKYAVKTFENFIDPKDIDENT